MTDFWSALQIHNAILSVRCEVLADRREHGVALESSSGRGVSHRLRELDLITLSGEQAELWSPIPQTEDAMSIGEPLYRTHAELISQYLAVNGIINASTLGSVEIFQIAHSLHRTKTDSHLE